MADRIKAHVKSKDYDAITSAKDFARRLTEDLQAVSHDKHLRVHYSHAKLPVRPEGNHEPTAEDRDRMRRFCGAINGGFEKVERLEGNVGLLKFNGFVPPEFAGETAVAAMNFLASSDALIVDLRENGGGDPAMVALICSYLFGAEQVHLNDLYFRPANETQQFWTLSYVPGRRYEGKPVYVLTSHRTFSGAEEFTYNLKTRKRATIVGETTGGGANPGGPERIDDHFQVNVPSGRAINPVTKTNWEGTGVAPDVDVPADQAFHTAYLRALKQLEDNAVDRQKSGKDKAEPPMLAEERTRAVDRLQKELDALKSKAKPDKAQPAKDHQTRTGG